MIKTERLNGFHMETNVERDNKGKSMFFSGYFITKTYANYDELKFT